MERPTLRLRLPELLEERGLTAYAVVKATEGAISSSAMHRYVADGGAFDRISGHHLAVLCHALSVTPNELLQGWESTKKRAARS